MPPEMTDPSHIPHYPEWPNVPYADWPRSRFYRWNDTEPANLQPWWSDCCNHNPDPCVCVTSADVDLWNSYSGLSGLTAFDASALSAAFDQLSGMTDYSAVKDAADTVCANSAIWNSAGYVPNIYENLSALYDYLNEKADYSAFSAFHIWSDSLKQQKETGIYGDFGATIVGDGTYERPLRVAKDIVKAMVLVESATSGYMTGLVNNDTLDKLLKNFSAMSGDIHTNATNIYQNEEKIEWIINHLKAYSAANMWYHKKVTLDESKRHPDNFYYWEEK